VKAFHADDAALDVTASILADGKVSRLYKRLVYELQVASGVVAYQASGRLDGRFVIHATARPGHSLPELQAAIDAEIKKLAETGPTAREVQRVINSIESDFIGAMETVGSFGGKADRLNYYDYYTGEPDSYEKDLARYRAVTPAEVQRVLKKYVVEPRRVLLSVVPEGKQEQAVTKEARP
jgi:zinc protease